MANPATTADTRVPTPPSLELLLHDSRTHPFMLEFLQKRQAEHLLMFWADCEQFKQLMGKTNEISSQAKKIVDIHFNPSAKTRDMLGEAETEKVLGQFKRGKPSLDIFASAQRECIRQLRANHYPAFLESRSYREMVQASVDIKTWDLLQTFRDVKRVRALNLLLLVERPEFVETLRFTIDLRHRYNPLLAEGMLPVNDVPGTTGKKDPKGLQQKLHVVKELIDLGKFLETKYLSSGSKQFARGVSMPTAARVKTSLEECATRLEAATHAANQNISVQAANQASAATRWVRAGALGSGTTPSAVATSQVGPSASALDDTVRMLGDAFRQAEEEAVNWLERYAIADARKTDYFLSPVNEPASPSKSIYVEDSPAPESILVLRMGEQDMSWRFAGPHKPRDRDSVLSSFAQSPLSHVVVLDTTHIMYKNKDEVTTSAADVTGATVSGTSRGLKFRTKVLNRFSYATMKAGEIVGNARTPGTLIEEESVIQQASRVTSLAGVSQQEAVVENAARSKSQTGYDAKSLANTELHAHCFPLNLAVEVDPVAFLNESESQTYFHYVTLPCKASKHSFEHDCTCLYSVCMTRVTKRTILVPVTAKREPAGDVSTLSIDSPGSFSISKSRGKSPRNQSYSETALSLQKVPNFGLGLNLALNRDGSVEITRFVSDVQNPSPAAASGRIAVEDELLYVNRVSVHGRRFDDIVGQIKNASSPVYLRFARGNYLEAVVAKASSLSGDSDRLVEVPSTDGEGTEEMVKFTIICPQVVCVTSQQPIFATMRDALENVFRATLGGEQKEEDSFEDKALAILSTVKLSKELTWRIDLRQSLFNFLDVSRVVDIISAILLEKRIIIVSDLPERVAPAVISLLQIIRPFSWRHDFSALLPESHLDWFASRVSTNKPFIAGICTVDVVPPPIDQYIPRRQGRMTQREDIWAARERDFMMPCERLPRNAGYVRAAVAQLTSAETLIIDLDADRLSGNLNPIEKDHLPIDLRANLIADLNLALGRGGVAQWVKVDNDSSSLLSGRVNEAVIKLYSALNLHRCGEYVMNLRDGVLGFYRGAFLGGIKNEGHLEYLEKLTKTETFRDFVSSNWDLNA